MFDISQNFSQPSHLCNEVDVHLLEDNEYDSVECIGGASKKHKRTLIYKWNIIFPWLLL